MHEFNSVDHDGEKEIVEKHKTYVYWPLVCRYVKHGSEVPHSGRNLIVARKCLNPKEGGTFRPEAISHELLKIVAIPDLFTAAKILSCYRQKIRLRIESIKS